MQTEQVRRVLIVVLLINAGLFAGEMVAGLLASSMGLVADSLDMLADALVYTGALLVHSRGPSAKVKVAHFSGVLQLLLACLGFAEVVRRVLGTEAAPDYWTMIWVSIVALVGNAVCLVLLKRMKSGEAHIQASVIFTNNDVLINVGVVAAGLLVLATSSQVPDLIIGAFVFALVLRGAVKILRI